MSGVNKVILLGRLGCDPEAKTLSSGNTVCRINLATSDVWKDKTGEKQERTEWHRVVVWGKLAEICGKFLRKGSKAYFEGRIQTREWEDKDGNKRFTTEIIATDVQFIGNKARDYPQNPATYAQSQENPDFVPEPDFDPSEELPF